MLALSDVFFSPRKVRDNKVKLNYTLKEPRSIYRENDNSTNNFKWNTKKKTQENILNFYSITQCDLSTSVDCAINNSSPEKVIAILSKGLAVGYSYIEPPISIEIQSLHNI